VNKNPSLPGEMPPELFNELNRVATAGRLAAQQSTRHPIRKGPTLVRSSRAVTATCRGCWAGRVKLYAWGRHQHRAGFCSVS
jgi:hypothetical protein